MERQSSTLHCLSDAPLLAPWDELVEIGGWLWDRAVSVGRVLEVGEVGEVGGVALGLVARKEARRRTCLDAVNTYEAGSSCRCTGPLSSRTSTTDSVLIHTPVPLLDPALWRCWYDVLDLPQRKTDRFAALTDVLSDLFSSVGVAPRVDGLDADARRDGVAFNAAVPTSAAVLDPISATGAHEISELNMAAADGKLANAASIVEVKVKRSSVKIFQRQAWHHDSSQHQGPSALHVGLPLPRTISICSFTAMSATSLHGDAWGFGCLWLEQGCPAGAITTEQTAKRIRVRAPTPTDAPERPEQV